jgi:hypothetical protein
VKFCTFEVATHVGRHCRVGAFHGGCIVDVNFATAWYLSQQGESEPQRLANGLAPADMLDFLRAGLRPIHAAEELFSESGPPADWWRRDPLPRGPNDETIVYRPEEVRLCAPVLNPARVGPDTEIVCREEPECQVKLAALGPYLVTPEEFRSPYTLRASVRINGEVSGQTHTGTLRSKFEQAIETLSRRDIVLPGDVIAFRLDLQPKVRRGDVVEFEIDGIGTLRTPVA